MYAHAYCTYSARLVKWVTENNRPVNTINNWELHNLLMVGQPSTQLPSDDTISQDIKAAYEKCQDRVVKLLQVSLFNIVYQFCNYTYSTRNTLAVSTLPRMPGCLQITALSLPGPFILNTKGRCSHSCLILLRLQRSIIFAFLLLPTNFYTSHTQVLRWPTPFNIC